MWAIFPEVDPCKIPKLCCNYDASCCHPIMLSVRWLYRSNRYIENIILCFKNIIWLNENYEKTENLKFLDFALVTDGVIKVFHEVIICKTCDQVIFISYGLKICRKFTGEHPCRSTISIKLQSNFVVWRRGVVVITTAQLHSTKSELGFCVGSNLLAARQRFAMVRISDNGPGWK